MSLTVIQLDPAETFASLRDRLLRADGRRMVLVPSLHGDLLQRGIHLVLLRRLSDRERLEVGLITTDRALSARARALGLPTFASVFLAEYYRPGWWRKGRPRERLGLAFGQSPRQRLVPARSTSPFWVALLVLLVTGLLAVAAWLLWRPMAIVTLRPAAQTVQVITTLVADPTLSRLEPNAIPAQTARGSAAWEAEIELSDDPVADRRRLRAQARQGLGAAADGLLIQQLDHNQMLVPGTSRFAVVDERFVNTTNGRQQLTMQANITGLIISQPDLEHILDEKMAAMVPDGAGLVEPIVDVVLVAVSDQPGAFQVTAQAESRATINPMDVQSAVHGQPTSSAAGFLNRLPLDEPPLVTITPDWWAGFFGRYPLLANRIRVDVLP